MNTFTALWNSTLDSTLWEEPPHVRLTFFTMMMARDPDQVVRMPMRKLAKKANLDPDPKRGYDLTEDAVAVLESPDRRSQQNQEFEGRRIRRLPDGEGWLILNGEKYEEEMFKLWERMKKTKAQRKRRAKERAAKALEMEPGAVAFQRATEAGATNAQVDAIVQDSLPSQQADEELAALQQQQIAMAEAASEIFPEG